MLGMLSVGAMAQRATDVLDRGLVAVKTDGGIFCSWRIMGEEYYDVKYNIYRDGTKLNDEPLNVSNFLDAGGSAQSKYSVEAVVRGVPQEHSASVTPWEKNYLELKMDHGDLKSTYIPNDACCADVDGDGELEILLKFDNSSDAAQGYLPAGYQGEYAIIEVYKLNGKKLWWIDLGPNMTDFQNNENNIVAYDWDGDGKAEAVLRASDGTVVHTASGKTIEIGDMNANYRPAGPNTGANFFVHEGQEFLLYLNGETGDAYQIMEYPLKRLEPGEYSLDAAWGDGYGHRSTKHFFGAPVLDGRNPSIFLARGIYTRHKMVAYDVDPATHTLVERWRWNNNTPGSSWYGQGYHNYGIADVDWDGRDEIVFGSMVIDDNGKGLSTSGLGHGDAQHCSDFDPYTFGQEIFACNESQPNNNYRDATTSKIYYRSLGTSDDGRAMMGKFVRDIPGAVGVSAADPNLVGAVAHAAVEGFNKGNFHITQNMRIYWDGDLCEETFDYRNGKNTAGHIMKAETGEIAVLEGSMTNNDTKGTPCYQGDVLGDWREEVIMRTANNNIRIFTTDMETPWRNYTLWHDHQYRQAMVWQMCGYNQPPHVSYFLGEMEGITMAPPALTMTGRTEIHNGESIGSAHDGANIIMCETGDMEVSVSNGVSPYIFTDNAPTWTQGHDDNNNITTTTYTHTLTGGAFAGAMRLVKQGSGVLVLPDVTQTYTGNTDVWGGTLRFDGTMQSSRVWLNRHTSLVSDGGKFMKGIQADYNAKVIPGGEGNKGTIETDSLILNFGSRLVVDLFSDGLASDFVKANVVKIETKDWTNGPAYLVPVVQLVANSDEDGKVAEGKYLIAEFGKVDGDITALKTEGLKGQGAKLSLEDGKLYVIIENYNPGSVTWTGSAGASWDVDNSVNFIVDDSDEERSFVPGDAVTFDDNAAVTDITVGENVEPSSITINNETKDFTFSGEGFVGDAPLVKNGAGSVTFNNTNSLGNVTINGGEVNVTTLANNVGQDLGSLGSESSAITISNNSVLGVNGDVNTTQTINVGEGGAKFNVADGKTMTMSAGIKGAASESVLEKTGNGTLTLGSGNTFSRLVINGGVVNAIETNAKSQLPATVEFITGELWDSGSDDGSTMTQNSANFVVPENRLARFYSDPRATYTGNLTGSGTFNVYATGVRTYFEGDWSQFTGTIVPGCYKRGQHDPTFVFRSKSGLANSTLQVDEGVTFMNNGQEVVLGNLELDGELGGTGTYVLGRNNADLSFGGSINGAPVRKEGTGTWTVASSIGSPGAVTVSGGIVRLNSRFAPPSSSMVGSQMTVENGGRLAGNGTVSNLVVRSGGVLSPGSPTDDDPSGCIYATSMINASSGSVINLNIKGAENTRTSRAYIKADNTLMLSGTINVAMSSTYTPKEGDEIVLWECEGTVMGQPTVNLPELPQGLVWLTDDLLSSGTLRIGNSTGIEGLPADAVAHCRLYTMSGVLVAEFDSTAAGAAAEAKAKGVASGTYILRMSADGSSQTVKVIVD